MNIASDSRSICSSTSRRREASASSSNGLPMEAADSRATMLITPASWAGPMTALFAFGHANRKRGPKARPHMP